jgi:hypothetical protein
MVHVAAATSSSKRQALPPVNHLEKILEASFLNHAYSIKHKLSDCNMVKSFITSRSLP